MISQLLTSAKYWVRRTPVRSIITATRHRGLRQSDCFLASYPKSGNTWLRHVLTHSLTGIETGWRSPFKEYSIIVGKHHDLIPMLPDQGRLIKTHEPYRDEYRRIILIVRDPRDVAVSQFHFNRQFSDRQVFKSLSFPKFFEMFLDGTSSVYGNWGSHTQSWEPALAEKRAVVIRYEEMKQKPAETLDLVLEFLQIDVDPELRKAAIADNTAQRMREKEQIYRESQECIDKNESDRTFVRAAKSGGWREVFTPQLEQELFDAFGEPMRKYNYLPELSS